ncbi:MAG: polyphosphate polymerase domain-containing protein [Oscillospiraceae bacterium]|jgi:hypothetical protein|nr:polyphosphate polymerase domain-containing protein [Oscillospiraceae bacterium]
MQTTFRRYEKKYLITREQRSALQALLPRYMSPDRFGEYLVQNLYYDTENWDCIRESIKKPCYKEKLRLRCYGVPNQNTEFFLELKKKFKELVCKRRIAIPAQKFGGRTVRVIVAAEASQIGRELDFYLQSNAVSEKIYISYNRTAFAGIKDEGLRVTFDTDIRFRQSGLDFFHPFDGKPVLPPGKTLMEVKTLGGMPVWMARALSEYKIFPTAFSKYGVCYSDYIIKQPGRPVKISA